MAQHTRLAAASIIAALTIACGPAFLAQTTVEAETWDDAISKIDCKYTSKNADGSFSVTGVLLTIDTQLSIEYHHPEIA